MATISDALTDALQYHRSGQLEQAGRLYEEVLRIDPSHPDALHLLGVIDHQQGDCRQAVEKIARAIALNPEVPSYYSNLGAVYRTLGEPDKAESHCRQAVRISADSAEAHNNLGNALADQGRLDEAVASFRHALQIRPDYVEALNNLGHTLNTQGERDAAEGCYRRALEVEPRNSRAVFGLGSLLQSRGKLEQAEEHYRKSLGADPHNSRTLNNLGSVLQTQMKLGEAEACYRRALQLTPDYAAALNNLGNLLIGRNELDQAEACYRRALEIDPGIAECHNALGALFQRRKMSEEALAHYRRALEMRPDYVDALANLAGLLETLNRLEEAAPIAARCLRLAPDHLLANLVSARRDYREGRFREGIERLERVRLSTPPHSEMAKDVSFELGRLYDRTDKTARAFACFTEANRLAGQESGEEALQRRRHYLQNVDFFGEVFTKEWVASWSPAPPMDEAESPAFLVGFPRSGTTLLQVVLNSHPGIRSLGEKSTFEALETQLQRFPGEHPRCIAGLATSAIESLRNTYFHAVERFVDRQPGTILVDKHPLYMAAVGLILRFFPTAKFIVVVRHPCDACLSCFMQNFQLTNGTANFFTLEDTATLYDKVTRLWRQYVDVLPHAYHLLRYEDLVGDFRGEMQRLLQFLGVGWDDSVEGYAEHARHTDWIHTPSYQQVVEPIYRRACGRWRRYARQLAPVMDVLRPHIEYFGYDS